MKIGTPLSPKPILPYFALLGVQALFGSLPVIGKVVLAVIPATALVGLRVGITAAVLYFVQRSRGSMRLAARSDYLQLAVLSIFGVVLNQLLFIGGLSRTKASNTSLLAVTIPIFTVAVSAAAGTEKLRALRLVGITVAATGVIIFIDPLNASFTSETRAGDLMIILNSLAYGIYVALSKDVVTRNGAVRSMAWLFIFASVVCVPAAFFSMSAEQIAQVSTSVWMIVAYIAIGATAMPYLLNAWSLARVEPSVVAAFVYLQPLIGFVLAVIFLGERVTARFLVAALFIFAGVFFATRNPGRGQER